MLEQVENIRIGGVAVRCVDERKFKKVLNFKMHSNYVVKVVGSVNLRITLSDLSERFNADAYA